MALSLTWVWGSLLEIQPSFGRILFKMEIWMHYSLHEFIFKCGGEAFWQHRSGGAAVIGNLE